MSWGLRVPRQGRCMASPPGLPPPHAACVASETLKSGVLAWNLPCWDGGGLSGLPSSALGTSSHPVGSRNPFQGLDGLRGPFQSCPDNPEAPASNVSSGHWLSLPGRPREGRSGAAWPPWTPRTSGACRLRVGAGCKDTAWPGRRSACPPPSTGHGGAGPTFLQLVLRGFVDPARVGFSS